MTKMFVGIAESNSRRRMPEDNLISFISVEMNPGSSSVHCECIALAGIPS